MKKHLSIFLATVSILLASSMGFALTVGNPAPDFSAKNQDGKIVQLSQFKGKFVLLYFYPKDGTSGCTKEACSFRDNYLKMKLKKAVILGISRQNEKSHTKFRSEHKLPFDLLADVDGKVAELYGIDSYPIVGLTKRQSVLIDRNGKIIRFYKDVVPERHAEEVLEDIEKASR